MAETVSSVLLRILKKHGIRHVFGLPAAQISMIMDGAGRDPWFSYLTVRHEAYDGSKLGALRFAQRFSASFGNEFVGRDDRQRTAPRCVERCVGVAVLDMDGAMLDRLLQR